MVSQTKSAVIVLLLVTVCVISCSKKDSSLQTVAVDPKEVPLMHSEKVSSLISDSGITRYRFDAEVWNVYQDEGKSSRWYFPEGIYIEKFDSLFNIEASVKADTAYYFENRELWQLIGNVKIMNLKQEKFETSELFWDRRAQRIYSDSLVRVEQEGGIISAIGFESNQEMSKYRFYKIQPSVIYIKPENENKISVDSGFVSSGSK